MDTSFLTVVLALVTLGAVVVFALVSKERTEARRRSNTPKSTLAADAPDVAPAGSKPVDT